MNSRIHGSRNIIYVRRGFPQKTNKKVFSNFLPNPEIENFARIDEFDLIKQIQEVYADYFIINSDLFTLNIDSTIGNCKKVLFVTHPRIDKN